MHPPARFLGCLAPLAFLAATSAPALAAAPCRTSLDRGVIPVWARAGFSDPQPRMPHVVGQAGGIVAIVFGDPLVSPPSRSRNNKILWVSRVTQNGPSDLVIHARRMRGAVPLGRPVTRRVTGGPGPSIIDLPRAGCWRMSLHWAGRSDSLDLLYRPR